MTSKRAVHQHLDGFGGGLDGKAGERTGGSAIRAAPWGGWKRCAFIETISAAIGEL